MTTAVRNEQNTGNAKTSGKDAAANAALFATRAGGIAEKYKKTVFYKGEPEKK